MSEFEQKQKELAELAEFEARLRMELVRVEAPAGFAERVMARAAKEPARRQASWRWTAYAAAAAVLAVTLIGGERVQQEKKRAQANEDFATAMQVTNRAMAKAQAHALEQMQRAGMDMNGQDNGSEKEER